MQRYERLDLALLLATEALRAAPTWNIKARLLEALHTRCRIGECLSTGSPVGIAFSPDGKTLAASRDPTGYGGSEVVLWDVDACTPLVEEPLAVPEGMAGGVAFSPDGTTLAAGYGDKSWAGWREDQSRDAGYACGHGVGGAVLWDVAVRTRLVGERLPVPEGGVGGVAFSPDGKTLAAGYMGVAGSGVGGGVLLLLWDAAARTWLVEEHLPVPEGGVGGVAFSPDGKTLAAGYMGVAGSGVGGGGTVGRGRAHAAGRGALGRVRGWGWEGGLQPRRHDPGRGVHGRRRERCRRGVLLLLWDAAARTWLVEERLPVPEGGVEGVAFSPDGKTLAAAFTPDGKALFSRAGGGRPQIFSGVVLWDVATRTRLKGPLKVSGWGCGGVAFSPDGKVLAAGFGDCFGSGSGVMLWDVDFGSWLCHAERIANRNFTRAEWQRYFPGRPYAPTFPNLPAPLEVR